MKYILPFLSIAAVLVFTSCKEDEMTKQGNSEPQINPTGNITEVRNFGGSKNESGESIVSTQDGGFAILGYTQSNNGDISDKPDDSFSFWLLKFDENNTLEWERTYGGTLDDRGADLVTTQDGGYIITGYVSSSDGDISTNGGNQDFWIAKLNASGNLLWEKSFGYSGSDRAYSIINTQDNGVLVSGVLDVSASGGLGNITQQTNTLHAGGDYWAIKLSSNGTKEWSKYFGGNLSDDPFGVAQTEDGNFILVGSSDSTDVDITNNKGSYDYWIISISNTGLLQWEKSFGGAEIDEARGITKTSDGNFVIIGNTRSDDQDISTNHGASDIWMVKINKHGDMLWEKNIGGTGFDIAYNIKPSNSGFIISGASRSQNIDISENNGQNDALIANIDDNGNIVWLSTVGGSNEDLAYDVTQLNNGEIMATGETTSNDIDLNNNKGFTDLLLIRIQ